MDHGHDHDAGHSHEPTAPAPAATPEAPKGPSPLQVEDQFYDILAGGAKASMLTLVLDMGLDRLLASGPLTSDEVVKLLDLDPTRGKKWMILLETLDLVEEQRTGDVLRYGPGPVLRAMQSADDAGGYFYREFMRYWRVAVQRDMVAVLRGADVAYEVRYPPEDPADVALLHDWMRSGAYLTLKVIERVFDFAGVGRMLDVGGGDATMACEIARKHPKPLVTVFNVPKAAALCRANVAAKGLGARVSVVDGDFLKDPLPGGFDLVMFSRVLADWSPTVCRMLLEKAFAALKPGGTLLVAEPFRDQNPGLSIAWEHSYLPYDDFGAYTYKPTTLYDKMMREVGFGEVESHPRTDSIHGVLVTHKP